MTLKAVQTENKKKFNPGDPAALRHATYVDRRQCERVVPMRVLALGFSRTGTASLRQALLDLGYTDCYHFSAPLQENPPDAALWVEAMEAKFEGKGKPYGRAEWDQLLGHCQAVTDAPCFLFKEELLEAYPDARVILTVRDSSDQWWESCMSTIVKYWDAFLAEPTNSLTKAYRWFTPVDPQFARMSRLQFLNHPVYSALLHDLEHGKRDAIKAYEAYNDEIRRIVPKEKLLVMNVKEGWEPLCRHLGKDIPRHPFPRNNDTQTFVGNFEKINVFMKIGTGINIAKTLGAVLAAGAAVALAAHRFRLVDAYQLLGIRK